MKIRIKRDLKNGEVLEVEQELTTLGDIENLDKHIEKLKLYLDEFENKYKKVK